MEVCQGNGGSYFGRLLAAIDLAHGPFEDMHCCKAYGRRLCVCECVSKIG